MYRNKFIRPEFTQTIKTEYQTSRQNTENSNQTDTSDKHFNTAAEPLLLAELVTMYEELAVLFS